MKPLDIDPQLLIQIYYWGVFFLCICLFFRHQDSKNCDKLLNKNSIIPSLIISVLLIIMMGLRPLSANAFGDTFAYSFGYKQLSVHNLNYTIDLNKEWLWGYIQNFCKWSGFSVSAWFLIIEIGYIGFVLLALKLLLWENTWIGMLFFLSGFSTFTYGTNGIRNGLACSMAIFAIAIAAYFKFKHLLIPSVVLFLLFGIHRSTMLPIAAFFAALFLVKDPKYAIYFWIASIGLSVVAGGWFTNFFMGLGFDDRMADYVTTKAGNEFSHSGFRWDFLLYSAMPVLLTWYVCQKIEDAPETKESMDTGIKGAGVIADAHSIRVFYVLSTTYILCNAFWVTVCRASFSNRFAYLSWFLYPIVIAYATVRLHIWKDQDQKVGFILMAHAGFTIFMYLIGK